VFRIGFIGGKEPRKGVHVLVKISELLRYEYVEWHLWGIDPHRGRTPYIQGCQTKVARLGLGDQFKWHGKTDDPASAYASVDAVLIPSVNESFGRVAIEAMSAGLPVVATRVTGHSEVIWDGYSGLLFDLHRPVEAASHLLRLMRDETLRAKLSEGSKKAVARFDISRVGPQLEQCYLQLLANALPEQDSKPSATFEV
jgi:glycosyltransferase involved in cell wall biosynthesis